MLKISCAVKNSRMLRKEHKERNSSRSALDSACEEISGKGFSIDVFFPINQSTIQIKLRHNNCNIEQSDLVPYQTEGYGPTPSGLALCARDVAIFSCFLYSRMEKYARFHNTRPNDELKMKHAPNKAATNMTKMLITSLHDDTIKKIQNTKQRHRA